MAEAVKEVVAEKKETNSGEKKTGMAVLTYFLPIIPFLTGDKDDKYVMFHTKQAIMLWITSIVVNIVLTFTRLGLIESMISLAIFVLFVMGVINASKGEEKEVPLVGQFAKDLLKF